VARSSHSQPPVHDGTKMERLRLVGRRDRALIAVMIYTFARIGAVLQMKAWITPPRGG